MKDTIKIEIDFRPIKENIEKYIKRKLQERIREEWLGVIEMDIDLPRINFPDIEKRLEALEDYINDLKMGFTKLK